MIMPGIGQALATIIYISGNTKTLVNPKLNFKQKIVKFFVRFDLRNIEVLKNQI
jgi:hypothetical protein